MQLPKDPVMLLSLMNTYLRDRGQNLQELCADLEISEQNICQTLSALGYAYDKEQNRFV